MTIDELLIQTKETEQWSEIMLVARGALASMGTFKYPLDKAMVEFTYGQWQHEQTKRVVISVLNYLKEKGIELGE